MKRKILIDGEKPVEIELELKDGPEGKEFSCSAVVWSDSSKKEYGMAGQIADELAPMLPERYRPLLRLWKRWHLNSMRAGSPAQEKALAEWRAAGNSGDYRDECSALEERGLLEDPGFMRDGKPYRYGTAWLFEPIDPDDLAEIEAWVGGGPGPSA